MQRGADQRRRFRLAGRPGQDAPRVDVLPVPHHRAPGLARGQRHPAIVDLAVAVHDGERIEPSHGARHMRHQVHGGDGSVAGANDLAPRDLAVEAAQERLVWRYGPAMVLGNAPGPAPTRRRFGSLGAEIIGQEVRPQRLRPRARPVSPRAAFARRVQQCRGARLESNSPQPAAPAGEGGSRNTGLHGGDRVGLGAREPRGLARI